MSADGWTRVEQPVPLDQATAGFTPCQVDLMERLARRLIDLRPMRWSTLTKFAKRGIDRVDIEETVTALFRAGWFEFRHKRDRAGNPEPTQLRLLESAVDGASVLIGIPSPTQREQTLVLLRDALFELRERRGPPIPERVLVRQIFGTTKSIRIRDLRADLESTVGVPLEDLVRFHVDVALTAGPARFQYRDVPVDLRGSSPWMAITEPVAAELSKLVLEDVDELVCVENQTVFESLLYEGLADTSVVLFTAGYLGKVQRDWIRKLLDAGIRRVRHWGDLDPWGLDIYRDLRSFVLEHDPRVEVAPWRMEPDPLERSDTQRLTAQDWVALHRYLKREDPPLRETAEAMKRLGRKLEQEALLDGRAT